MYASNEISILQNHLSLRVGFEPTREDPIWFRVKRLNHSAIAAKCMGNYRKGSYFISKLGLGIKGTLRVGFEPTREDPIRFQV